MDEVGVPHLQYVSNIIPLICYNPVYSNLVSQVIDNHLIFVVDHVGHTDVIV